MTNVRDSKTGRFVKQEYAEKVCLMCNISFKVVPFRRDTAKFCSHKCQGQYVSSSKRIHRICENCLSEFSIKPGSIGSKGYIGRFCKIDCYHAWQKSVATYTKGDRDTQAYKMWRFGVFKRDNFTCKKCGKVSGKLAAHHLLPVSLFPEYTLDTDNGVTMCWECHWNLHSIYRTWNRKSDEFSESCVAWNDLGILSQAQRDYLNGKVQRLPDYRLERPVI
jgi:5-methylcytosine-specific restriction endonuclease McrA